MVWIALHSAGVRPRHTGCSGAPPTSPILFDPSIVRSAYLMRSLTNPSNSHAARTDRDYLFCRNSPAATNYIEAFPPVKVDLVVLNTYPPTCCDIGPFRSALLFALFYAVLHPHRLGGSRRERALQENQMCQISTLAFSAKCLLRPH